MQNCAMCHGDALDGNGIFARAWQPRPANFRDTGTIAQLDENYVFWRIKEGGPGVPRGSIEYRSSMPIWDGVLGDDEIWKIIMFEYTNAGVKPAKRAME
jgi:mono/diheme cytochrome c family protein